MDLKTMLQAQRVLFVAGKGGVGKTAMSCALAQLAKASNLNTLLVFLDKRPDWTKILSSSLSDDATHKISTNLTVSLISSETALIDYLSDHGFKRIIKRLASSGVLEVVSNAIPGIREVLVLGKIKQLERKSEFDLIIVDSPATGHALTLLGSASGLLKVAKSGPVKEQSLDVLEMLTDPSRSRLLLVTIPEETPVNETIEAAFAIEEMGVKLGPLFVNRFVDFDSSTLDVLDEIAQKESQSYPGLNAAREALEFRHNIWRRQMNYVQFLSEELPLSQIVVNETFGEISSPEDLSLLATNIANSIEDI